MKKVIVGRPINGISLNGLEYILDDEGEIRYFDSAEEAKELLREHGYDDEDFDDYLVFKESTERTCFRCGSPLFQSDLPDYTYQCFHCDEDFYAFEQEDRLSASVTAEQKQEDVEIARKVERVVIVVEDGTVTDVYTTNRNISVEIIDKDVQMPEREDALSKALMDMEADIDAYILHSAYSR